MIDRAPQLSILTLCFNEAEYLAETLGSMRAQFYRHWECVLIDNGSTDASAAEIRAVIKFDRRFRVETFARNQPFPIALNYAASRALAPWLLVHNADDRMETGYLAAIAQVIATRPDVTCIYSPWHFIGRGETRSFPPYDPATMVDTHQIPGIRAMRRDLWELTGGEDEAIHVGSDWDWAVRASLTDRFVPYQLDRPYVGIRTRPPGRVTLSAQADFPRLFAHMRRHRPNAWASWHDASPQPCEA